MIHDERLWRIEACYDSLRAHSRRLNDVNYIRSMLFGSLDHQCYWPECSSPMVGTCQGYHWPVNPDPLDDTAAGWRWKRL